MIYPTTTTTTISPESQPTTPPTTSPWSPLRILLETDAPYMIPANIYPSLYAGPPEGKGMKSNTRLPLSHCGMVPWTAGWVAEYLNSKNPAVVKAKAKGEAVEEGNGEVKEKEKERK
jgi:TatD DNase family protein